MYLWWSLCTLTNLRYLLPGVQLNTGCINFIKDMRMYFWRSLCTLCLLACQVKVLRRLGSLLLCFCDVFRALINSLVCWFLTKGTSSKILTYIYSRSGKIQGILLGVGSSIHHDYHTDTATVQLYYQNRAVIVIYWVHSHTHANHRIIIIYINVAAATKQERQKVRTHIRITFRHCKNCLSVYNKHEFLAACRASYLHQDRSVSVIHINVSLTELLSTWILTSWSFCEGERGRGRIRRVS